MRVRFLTILLLSTLLVSTTPIIYNASTSIYIETEEPSLIISVASDPVVQVENDTDFADQGWPGNGEKDNPYIIQDLEILSSGTLISISNTRSYVTISNCSLPEYGSWGEAISLDNVSHITIQNCRISKDVGITVVGSSNVHILDSSFLVDVDSVVVYSSSNCSIIGNEFTDNKTRYSTGIKISNSHNWTISENTMQGTDFIGFSFSDSYYLEVSNNIVKNNLGEGMRFRDCEDFLVEGNTFQSNQGYGLFLWLCKRGTIFSNNFENDGIMLEGSLDYRRHNFTDNTINGKELGYFSGVVNCTVDASSYGMLIINNNTNVRFEYCHIQSTVIGAILSDCENVTISDSIIGDNKMRGIDVEYCSDFALLDSQIINNTENNIWAYSIDNLTIAGNMIQGPVRSGIGISSCTGIITGNRISDTGDEGGINFYNSYVNMTDNELTNSGILVSGSVDCFSDFSNNTVNGKDIGIFIGTQNTIIDASTYGQLLFDECYNLSVSNAELPNASLGLYIYNSSTFTFDHLSVLGNQYSSFLISHSSDVKILESSISSLRFGIYNSYSNYTSVANTTFLDCAYRIFSSYSSYLTVDSCEFQRTSSDDDSESSNTAGVISNGPLNHSVIKNSSFAGLSAYAISVRGFNISILKNNISRINGNGIEISGSNTSSRIVGNKIYDCTHYGIYISSSGNLIYDNEIGWNLYGNAVDIGGNNAWDDGISRGNFWSHMSNPTLYNVPGSANSVDHYPVPLLLIQLEAYPDSLQLDYGSTGFVLNWNITSYYHSQYSLFLNGTTMASGQNEGSVVVSLDFLVIGVHNFTLVVVDELNHKMISYVSITVNGDGTTTTTTAVPDPTTTGPPSTNPTLPQLDVLGIIIIGVIMASLVVIIVIIFFRRKPV